MAFSGNEKLSLGTSWNRSPQTAQFFGLTTDPSIRIQRTGLPQTPLNLGQEPPMRNFVSRREQKFWQQHYNQGNSRQEIEKQMRQINSGQQKCKPLNTIIHGQRDNIEDICTNPNSRRVLCRDKKRDNCFEGPNTYSVTVCNVVPKSVPPNCRYTCNKEEPVKITVACENGKPVHYDKTRKIAHDEL